MKRILLFLAALVLASTASVSFAQSGNHVLVEEFNSSTCPPCAETDPIIESFETQDIDSICILKWHQNYPAPGNDPFYTASAGARAAYYNVQGIPNMLVNGDTGFTLYYLPSSVVTEANAIQAAMPDYYQMHVSHQIIGDSIIVFVTVTTGATQPAATDLNLGVVVAQRFAAYRGANGRPFHTNVALAAIPPLSSTGAINNRFIQAANSTVTYRYATQLKPSWDKNGLMAVAFIQSKSPAQASGTKEIPHPVYQSAWDVPSITISGDGFVYNPATTITGLPAPVIAGDASSVANYTITNNTASTQKVFISAGLQTPANYSVMVSGLGSDSSVSIPAGNSVTLPVSVTSNGPALTSTDYYITARTDSVGLGGGADVAFGKDIQHAIVDLGGQSELDYTEPTKLQTSMKNAGYTAGIINDNSFVQIYGSDWSQFKTVIFDDGWATGVNFFSDTGNITNLLSSGGNFVMMAEQFPAWCASNSGLDQWMQNTFHMENNNLTQGGYTTISGIPGDPIGGAVAGKISVASNMVYTASVYGVDDSAHAVYVNPSGDTVAMRATSEGGKTFYSSFELGEITPTKRDAAIKALMDWFYPSAGVNDRGPSTACSLDPAYPNPLLSNSSTIGYTLPDTRYVTLKVRDMMGRNVATLVSKEQGAGHYTAPFDASHLANGTYIYTLTAGHYKASGKVTVDH